MLWLKWHSLNFSLKFLSLSHRIEKKAANDVESANNDTSKRIKYQNGAGLNYENEVASKYYDFWGRDFNPKRMDTYVLILFIEVIGVVFINTLFPDFFSLLKYFEFIAITVFCLIVMELIVEYSKKKPFKYNY